LAAASEFMKIPIVKNIDKIIARRKIDALALIV